MEGNKDESLKCINIARRCIEAGHYDKAVKFLNKAERLYPSKSAKGDCFELLKSMRETAQPLAHLSPSSLSDTPKLSWTEIKHRGLYSTWILYILFLVHLWFTGRSL